MKWSAQFPRFGLRLTRWGAVYLLGMLVLGLAAVNTGNNALVILFGLVAGSFIVSGTWSRQVLGGAGGGVVLPRRIFAGRAEPLDVTLTNGSRIFPAYGLGLLDGGGHRVLVEPLVAPRASVRRTAWLEVPRRGWQELGPWRVEVVLPLGFFVKTKELVPSRRVLVYPALLPGSSVGLAAPGAGTGEDRAGRRGRNGEVRELRDYRDGDEPRQIHWKQTARQGRLIAVDRETLAPDPLFVVVDPRIPERAGKVWRERLERIISEAATVVVERLESGLPVGVVAGRRVTGPLSGLESLDTLMRPLAELEPLGMDEAPPEARSGFRVVRFSATGGGA
ncbi:MAG TPA: DUF58 domain-containing protein [Acidobacteria bacterium]|nr:DUF58 domain-containing protein [Acidobacteriota bacterium]